MFYDCSSLVVTSDSFTEVSLHSQSYNVLGHVCKPNQLTCLTCANSTEVVFNAVFATSPKLKTPP